MTDAITPRAARFGACFACLSVRRLRCSTDVGREDGFRPLRFERVGRDNEPWRHAMEAQTGYSRLLDASSPRVAGAITLMMVAAGAAQAHTFCVSTADGLQSALD